MPPPLAEQSSMAFLDSRSAQRGAVTDSAVGITVKVDFEGVVFAIAHFAGPIGLCIYDNNSV